MKKFLLSLAVLFASTAIAQTQYKTVDMLTEIPGDEAFLLAGDPDGNQFLTTNGEKNLTTAPDDNALIIFEATGERTVSGYDLYAIKFQATGEYIEDQVITDGMDSSRMLNYKFPYFATTADLGSAAKWTILPAATRYKAAKGDDGWEENWRTYTSQGTGTDTEVSTGYLLPYDGAFVIMRDKLTDGNGSDPVYFEVWNDYTMFAPWGNNDWYLFTYEEKTVDDLLQEWWDTNYPEGPEALESAVGNKVGQYKEESMVGLLAAYEAYVNWLIEGEGEAEEIYAQSKAAYEALEINEMTDGYYYLITKRYNSGVMDDNGVMRGDEGFEIPRKEDESIDLTVESSRYLWYFTENPEKGTYTIKNFGTGKYVKTAAHGDNTGIKTGDLADAVDYTVVYSEEFPGTVIFKHFNEQGQRDCSWNCFPGNGKVIGNWYPEDDGNSFFLYNVDEELVDANAEEILNNNLQELYDEAVCDYRKGFAYEPKAACTRDDVFSNHGLLTYEKDEAGEPALDEEGNVISNMKIVTKNGDNAVHTSDGFGSVVGLLDDKWDTHTHTVWDSYTHPHYFEIDLGEGNELDAIALKMMRRTHTSEFNANFGIGETIVYARNSEEEDWVRVANLAMTYDINLYARGEDGQISVDEEGNPVLQSWDADNGENYVGIGTAGLGAEYRYLRLQHYKTIHNMENFYFAACEMALFGATYAPEKSLNRAVPADILATFESEMAKAKIQLEAGKATEAQIVALQNAYEAYLENFPQPKLLKDAIAEAKIIALNLPVDDTEVGYYPQSALNAYEAVIAEVEASVEDVMTLAVINECVDKLNAAKTELMKSLNMFASGFYQVKMAGGWYEEALMHSSCVADDTKDVKGAYVEFAKQSGNVDDGFFDDENYINKVSSVWYFEVGDNNKVAIRSLANGLYLKPVLSNFNYAQMTEEKVWFEVQADGLVNGGLFNIILGNDTTTATKGRPLYANNHSSSDWTNGYLIAWESANGGDNSSFKFEEVDLADFGYGANTFVLGTNKTQFFTLPYDAVMYGQSAKVCEVVGYYEDSQTGEKAVYFKNIQKDGAILNAGQAYLVQTDDETEVLTVELEDDVAGFDSFNYSYEAKEVNGLQATIFSEDVHSGFGVFNIANRIVATENSVGTNGKEELTTISPMSGYLIPSKLPILSAVPEGDEYVKIVSLVDLDEEIVANHHHVLEDGVVYSSYSDKEVKSVTYTRTLPNLYWNALYLPFEVPYETIADKYNAAYINAIRSYDHDDDGALDELEMEIVKIKAGTLKANYPYLIQAKTEYDRSLVIKVEDATLYAAKENSIDCSTVYQKYEVTGTYNVKTAAQLAGKLAISIDGAWQPLLAGSQLNPYRLYLSITNRNDSPVKVSPAALSRVRIVEKGQYTGIDSVDSAPAENVFYDLSGRRVMQPVKGGVYIQNGKKVIL